jgi:hypothetical protein
MKPTLNEKLDQIDFENKSNAEQTNPIDIKFRNPRRIDPKLELCIWKTSLMDISAHKPDVRNDAKIKFSFFEIASNTKPLKTTSSKSTVVIEKKNVAGISMNVANKKVAEFSTPWYAIVLNEIPAMMRIARSPNGEKKDRRFVSQSQLRIPILAKLNPIWNFLLKK